MIRVDIRSTPIDVPKQRNYYKDNVTVGVDAVGVPSRNRSGKKPSLETTNYVYATSQFAQAALRDVTGNADMDELLSKREEISQKSKKSLILKPISGVSMLRTSKFKILNCLKIWNELWQNRPRLSVNGEL